MKRLLLTILIAAGLCLPAAAADQLKVVAVYPDFGWLAEQVGGGHVSVSVLAKGSQDPHYVDPKPSFLRFLHHADLLLLNGLDLEAGFLPPLLQQSGNRRIQPGTPGYVDCSAFITPIGVPAGGVDRSMGDVHAYGNPHYHLDPANMAAVARGLGDIFAAADPAHAEDYRRNAGETAEAMTSLDAELHHLMASASSRPVVTYHATLDYFFLHFGFTVVGFVEPKPGIKPSPGNLLKLEQSMKEKGVKLLICEVYQDRKIAAKVAADTGAKLVVIPSYTGGTPEAATYPELMRTIARAIVESSSG
jgi:zinc/manganese transport system substrate-binding protein